MFDASVAEVFDDMLVRSDDGETVQNSGKSSKLSFGTLFLSVRTNF